VVKQLKELVGVKPMNQNGTRKTGVTINSKISNNLLRRG
jgi:hypothetical protein